MNDLNKEKHEQSHNIYFDDEAIHLSINKLI